MKCTNCGYEIPSGELYCKRCGEEVFIVPDYNPLDDMLTAQIKVSINDDGKLSVDKKEYAKVKNTNHRRNIDEREARRRQAERRRELKRKKRRRLLIIMAVALLLFITGMVFMYLNSYTGIVNKGNKALTSSEYALAKEYFEQAIEKKPEQPDAYNGLAQLYVAKNNLMTAEKVYKDAIKLYPDNSSLYEACILFYIETNQPLEIPKLLKNANKSVKNTLSKYVIEKPKFSLDDNEIYDDVQQLTLTSVEKTIYYTTDGTDPTLRSTKYTEPIQLDEGETVVKAISVNEEGIPSVYAEKVYIIELPIEDAPAISPSTGQYDQNTKIEIKVPEGYTAYYTMDGSTPTTASKKYTEPIDMPENDTLFKAILVNSNGRSSGVTTRNYILDINE